MKELYIGAALGMHSGIFPFHDKLLARFEFLHSLLAGVGPVLVTSLEGRFVGLSW